MTAHRLRDAAVKKNLGNLARAGALAALAAAAPGRAAALDATAARGRIEALKSSAFAGAPPAATQEAPPAPAPGPAIPPAPTPARKRALPDFSFTPGKLCTPDDSDFEEYRYPEHIAYCRRHVSVQMKEEVAAHYGISRGDWGKYEFDHLIPLAIGGDSHIDNLWPQPWGDNDSGGKDLLEKQLYEEMKEGTITQVEAVNQIYDWFKAYQMSHAADADLEASHDRQTEKGY